MSIILKIELLVASFSFLIFLILAIRKNRLSVKHALLWLASVVIMIIAVIIPNFIETFSKMLGFQQTTNMIFLFAFLLLLFITFSLSVTISNQSEKIRLLIQEISILKSKNDQNKE